MWASPHTGVGSRIVRGTSAIVPTLVGIFCVIATVMPYGSIGGITLGPVFPLAAIFFFTLTRPASMTPISVFAIGIVQDLLTGSPAGLWALVYLVAYGVTAALRVLFIGRSASAAWPGFLIVAGVACVSIWALASIFYGVNVPIVPVAGQLLLTAAVYPVLAWVFALFLPASEG